MAWRLNMGDDLMVALWMVLLRAIAEGSAMALRLDAVASAKAAARAA